MFAVSQILVKMNAAKNIEKSLQSRKFFAPLLLRQSYISHIADTYKIRLEACPCYTSASCGCSSVARKGGTSLFLYTVTNLFLAKCDRAKQVVTRYKVPVLRLFTISRKPSLSSCCKAPLPNRCRRTICTGALPLLRVAGATTLSKVGSRLYAALRASSKRSKKSITTDSPCRSWKRKAKAAFGRTRVPRPHRTFSPSRTSRSPRSFNPSLWPSLSGSPLCCA